MNRRDVMLALLAVGAAPLAALAQQQGKVWRVGVLGAGGETGGYSEFRRGLRDLGYAEGKDLVIEWRFAEGKYDRLPALVKELIQLRVDVIVASPSQAIKAAQEATTTLPIVMASTGDPVGAGFVKSLAQPGGNITGLSNINVKVSTKLLDLLLAAVPKLTRIAVLVEPSSTSHHVILTDIQAAGRSVGVMALPVKARTPEDIESAFPKMKRENFEAIIAAPASLFVQQGRQLAELTRQHRMPAIFGNRSIAEAGGLMSYGAVGSANYYRAAAYVDKIFKGAKPADLPVEQPTKLEFVINMKTASALGLTIPQAVLARADDVIR